MDDYILIAEEADEIAQQEIEQALKNEIQISLQGLKIAAMNYCQIMEREQEWLQNFTTLLQKQQQIRHQLQNYNELQEYQKNRQNIGIMLKSENPAKIVQSSLQFQQLLNNFLGQKTEIVYVYKNSKNQPQAFLLKGSDYLKYGYNRFNELSARFQLSKKKLSSIGEVLKLNAETNYSEKGLNATYTEVMNRYENNRKKKYGYYVHWRTNAGKYTAMSVSSRGDINEAYAGFIILNKKFPGFNHGDIEININDFMIEGVSKVDNLSGLLKGDITQGNIEYGIKSAGASILSIAQILPIAKMVLQEDFSIQKLQQIQQQEQGIRRNNIIELSKEAVERITKELVKN